MEVTTRSGSKYLFTVRDNKVYFMKGIHEGVVVSLNGLKVGNRLEIEFYPLSFQTYKQSKELLKIRTTEIIRIQ